MDGQHSQGQASREGNHRDLKVALTFSLKLTDAVCFLCCGGALQGEGRGRIPCADVAMGVAISLMETVS